MSPEGIGHSDRKAYPHGVRFRAVFFDVGETLVHVDPSFVELFVMVLADAGHRRGEEEVREASAHVYARFSEAARDRSMWTTSPERSRAFWTSVYDRMLAELDIADADGLASSLHREFTRMENYVLFDDVRPAIASATDARPPARHRVELRGMARGVVRRPRARRDLPGPGDLGDRRDREAGPPDLPLGVGAGGRGRGRIRVRGRQPGVRRGSSCRAGHVPGARRPPGPIPGHTGARVRDLRDLPGLLETA